MIADNVHLGNARHRREAAPASGSFPSKIKSIGERLEQKCESSMAAHPLATVVAAVVGGVILGWLIKRR